MARERRQSKSTQTSNDEGATIHQPVLLHEVVDGLALSPADVVVDATLGAAGHARAIAERLSPSGVLIGLDRDRAALTRGAERLAESACRVYLREANFRDGAQVLEELSFTQVDKVVMDLGLSSWQLETSGRGFSFARDEPLHMTFSASPEAATVTAQSIVNEWQEESIADILYGFGGERYARRIARAIAAARTHAPITRTRELVQIIEGAVPSRYRSGPLHPATRTFQALRMAVNEELDALSEGLAFWRTHLAPAGRIAVISFHSGEDRIVKREFQEAARCGEGHILTKKPITPGEEERLHNPRARSAKLRIFAHS